MIKTVLLDVDNTLLDFNKCADISMRNAAQELGVTLTDDTPHLFHTINARLWKQIEAGELTREELHRVRWRMVLNAAGIATDADRFEKLFVEGIRVSAVPVDGALDLLEYLAPRYTLCVASNASLAQQIHRLTKAGMIGYMKHIFVSENVGVPKPAPEFFAACMAGAGHTDKSEVMMIGDSINADINGASSFGIRTCWFNIAREPIPDDIRADYAVERLCDIKSIL